MPSYGFIIFQEISIEYLLCASEQSLKKTDQISTCLPRAYTLVCVTYGCMHSCVQLFATPWTVAHQASLSMEFPRQEY